MRKIFAIAKCCTAGVMLASFNFAAGSAPAVVQPLPPALEELAPAQPTPNHVWIPGHWYQQNDGFAWAFGHWDLSPREGATWIGPRWDPQGGGFMLVEGFWQDAQPGGPEEIMVTEAPPPPPTEFAVPQPSPRHVWIAGYWVWRGGHHVWISGRWELPPREHVVWMAPRWERRDGRVFFAEGGWRESRVGASVVVPVAPGVVVAAGVVGPSGPRELIIREAPPPLRHEIVRERPSPNHIWIAGYWAWRDGRYLWLDGHWMLPPHKRAVWEAPRWELRDGSYVFIEGHWR